jgi:hypothetical protein
MSYERFKLPKPAATVATLASVAGGIDTSTRARVNKHTAKFNNNNNNNIEINGLRTSEADSSTQGSAAPPAPICADMGKGPATVATIATLRVALAAFKKAPASATIKPVGPPKCSSTNGRAYARNSNGQPMISSIRYVLTAAAWPTGAASITALGPDHAVTESNRVFDRITRQTWINPHAAEIKQ